MELRVGEVRGLHLAEEDLDALELLAVAGGDRHSDLDLGRPGVPAGPLEGAREGSADLPGGQRLEREGDPI